MKETSKMVILTTLATEGKVLQNSRLANRV